MHKKAVDYFRSVDPLLYSVINKTKHLKPLEKSENFLSDLCEAIINQQLSDKAAATIFAKFQRLFPKGIITAKELLKTPDGKIREAGTSWKKVEFIKNLAKKIVRKELELEKLNKLKDHEVITELTKLHGIGKWTAEMFLMFSLAREDVFSAGDLGLRRAIQNLYKLKKEPTLKQI